MRVTGYLASQMVHMCQRKGPLKKRRVYNQRRLCPILCICVYMYIHIYIYIYQNGATYIAGYASFHGVGDTGVNWQLHISPKSIQIWWPTPNSILLVKYKRGCKIVFVCETTCVWTITCEYNHMINSDNIIPCESMYKSSSAYPILIIQSAWPMSLD